MITIPSKNRWPPLPLLAAMLVLLIAGLAGANLWFLVKLYEKASRSAAAMSVLQYGQILASHLMQQPLLREPSADKAEWDRFNQVVDVLRHVEPALEHVTLTENGIVIYHRQAETASAGEAETASADDEPMVVGRNRIYVGSNIVPVITFTRKARLADGRERTLQVALKKEIVEKEQAGAKAAIDGMFVLSLITLGVALIICLVVIVALVQHELKRQRRRQFEEHLAFAGAMAGSIIHDFRNPMSAMRLDAQLLAREAARGATERLPDLAGRIIQTIDRMDGLFKEFLSLSKPEAAGREPIDINFCILDCIELVKLRFERSGIKIVLRLTPDPLLAKGFPDQLQRALLNIIHNAEQFSPEGGTVVIATRAEGGEAVVEISDEGPGIVRADHRRIFDLFFSRRPGGTGIGLALAKAAVERCGGRIEVQSPVTGDKGSLFVVRIPRQP